MRRCQEYSPTLARNEHAYGKPNPNAPQELSQFAFLIGSAGFDAYLLNTPGHSPGSLSVFVGHEIAVVGDAMFGVAPRSVFPPFAWAR
jgi:glyoxylase-like metal-dependent hydrolase (beta-lactamase superfamily II)